MAIERSQSPTEIRHMQPITVRPGEEVQIRIIGAPRRQEHPLRQEIQEEPVSLTQLRGFVARYGEALYLGRSGGPEEQFDTFPTETEAITEVIQALRRDGISDAEVRRQAIREISTWQQGSIDRTVVRQFANGVVDEMKSYAEKHLPVDEAMPEHSNERKSQ